MGLEVHPVFFGVEGGSPIDKSCLLDKGSITNDMSLRVVIKLKKKKSVCTNLTCKEYTLVV